MDRDAVIGGAPGTAGATGDGKARPLRDASSLRRHGLKLAASLLLGGAIAWVLMRGGLPLVPPGSAFAALRPWAVVAYVASLALLHFIRAIRWRHLLRPIGRASTRSILAVSWIAFGAILLSPFRSGEIVRPYLISRRSSVSVWEAAGTVGAERVLDGLVLSVMLFIGLQVATPLAPLPDHVGNLPVPAAAVPKAAYGALALFVAAFTLMGAFFVARGFARRVAVIGLASRGLAERLAGIVEGVADGLRFLPSPRHLVPFIAETLAYWAVNAAGVQLLAWGCGLTSITFAQAAVTVGCLGVGVLVPSGPGFFGAFQLSTYMALAMYFPEATLTGPGGAFVFSLYATQVGFHLVAMVAGLVIDRSGAPVTASSPAPQPLAQPVTVGEPPKSPAQPDPGVASAS
jgi:glycosyltransferase 2 family protein